MHLPKGKMREAHLYAPNSSDALTRFLTDAKIPISNNHSERHLPGVALGRKNNMSVGPRTIQAGTGTLPQSRPESLDATHEAVSFSLDPVN